MISRCMPKRSEVEKMPRKRNTYTFEELQNAIASGGKNYVRYEEGAKLFSVGRNTFIELANEADAVYKYHGCAIVSVRKINEFIEKTWDLER